MWIQIVKCEFGIKNGVFGLQKEEFGLKNC